MWILGANFRLKMLHKTARKILYHLFYKKQLTKLDRMLGSTTEVASLDKRKPMSLCSILECTTHAGYEN